MAKSGKGYLNAGLPWIVNLILAIIPFTSWLLGGVTRIINENDCALGAAVFIRLCPRRSRSLLFSGA